MAAGWRKFLQSFLRTPTSKIQSFSRYKNLIEVEKKFRVPPSFEEVLVREGAVLVKQKEFFDSYYDFTDFRLSLQDCWLRKRNNSWELKHKSKDTTSTSESTTIDSYHELNKEDDILKSLGTYVAMDTSVESVQDFITGSRLIAYASFTTRRRRYEMDRVFIDLDSVSFGYDVGEIEVMVESEEDIADAEIKIESLAERLGITWTIRHYGKLEEYMHKNYPALFKQLVERKITSDK